MSGPDFQRQPDEARPTRPRFADGLSMRQRAALLALTGGPVLREAMDRATGSSNGPDIVSQLRGKGVDIECVRVEATDKWGEPSRPGLYRLTAAGKRAASALLLPTPRPTGAG
jgi:hypothetical protein